MNTQAYQSRKTRRFIHSAFGLVEIIAVIAVISVILAVTVPIFSNSSGNARQASREIIKAHIRQARAHAISTGVSTAIAIPSIQSGKDIGLRSLSIFEVLYENGVFKPRRDSDGNEIQLQRAVILPGDYHLVPQASIESTTATIVDAPDSMATNYGDQQHTMHIIVFSPNGQIVSPAPGTPIQIAIAKATQKGGRLQITEKSEGKTIFELVEVNRLTGKTRFVQP